VVKPIVHFFKTSERKLNGSRLLRLTSTRNKIETKPAHSNLVERFQIDQFLELCCCVSRFIQESENDPAARSFPSLYFYTDAVCVNNKFYFYIFTVYRGCEKQILPKHEFFLWSLAFVKLVSEII
jgi:hypothetical protein